MLKLLNEKLKNCKIGGYQIKSVEKVRVQHLKNANVDYVGYIKNHSGKFFSLFIFDNIPSKDEVNDAVKRFNKIRQDKSEFLFLALIIHDNIVAVNSETSEYFYTLEELKRLSEEEKAPIEVTDMIYNQEKSDEIYKKYSDYNEVTKLHDLEFSKHSIVGPLVQLCNDYNPISCYDLVNQYHNYAEENKHLYIIDRGLTREEVYDLAQRFSKRVKEVTQKDKKLNMTPYEAFHYLMYRIINITFQGYYAEKLFAEEQIKKGYLVKKTDKEMDKDYGVDLIVFNKDKDINIQIKPYNILLHNDEKCMKILKNKYEKFLKEKQKETFYAFYTKEENKYEWVKNPKTSDYVFDINIFK